MEKGLKGWPRGRKSAGRNNALLPTYGKHQAGGGIPKTLGGGEVLTESLVTPRIFFPGKELSRGYGKNKTFPKKNEKRSGLKKEQAKLGEKARPEFLI